MNMIMNIPGQSSTSLVLQARLQKYNLLKFLFYRFNIWPKFYIINIVQNQDSERGY